MRRYFKRLTFQVQSDSCFREVVVIFGHTCDVGVVMMCCGINAQSVFVSKEPLIKFPVAIVAEYRRLSVGLRPFPVNSESL